ncbi:MAG: hypothetical protein NT159_04350 [Proteobacteria bacterium]|nr:hypothetical protein [Pseudomonadota bacterium]
MAETEHTSNTEDGKALHDAMKEMIDEAQRGFVGLRSMALACGALIRTSEHGEVDDDLACATNLLYQLEEKAKLLGEITDCVEAKRRAKCQ